MKIAPGIVTVPNFLLAEECHHFINLSEENGYEEATISFPGNPRMIKRIRNNERVNWESHELAETLFNRIKDHAVNAYFDEPCELDPRFRFYRYIPGQQFKPHKDGSVKKGDLESKVTFMVYLNHDFDGGETIFRETEIRPGSAEEYIIKPETGMALLFQHQLRHEGAPVTTGTKYVLRTDIFYRKTDS